MEIRWLSAVVRAAALYRKAVPLQSKFRFR
jgi:hypothetical protein